MHRRRPVVPANDRAYHDYDDIHQEVLPISFVPRIRKRFKVRTDRLDVNQFFRHARHPCRGKTHLLACHRTHIPRDSPCPTYINLLEFAPALLFYLLMRAGRVANRSGPTA